MVLNDDNCEIWTQDMEKLLKSKVLWHFTKTMIPNKKYDEQNIVIDGKKDDAIEFITNYFSREIHLHTSGIIYPNVVWKKLKTFF